MNTHNAASGEPAQGIYHPLATVNEVLHSDIGVDVRNLSDNSGCFHFDKGDGTKEFHECCRAQRDSGAHDVLFRPDEYDEDDYDEDEITSDSDTLLHSDANEQSDSSEYEEDDMRNDHEASADGGWVIFHPYFDERVIKILDITWPVGNFPLHVLLEDDAHPGFENLEPFILHSIYTTAYQWTLVLETYIQGELRVESFTTGLRIYGIVRESSEDYDFST